MAVSNQGVALPPNNTGIIDSSVTDRAYQVRLIVKDDELGKADVFIGNLPERYHIEMSSSWSSPFAKSDYSSIARTALGDKAGSLVQTLSDISGISTKTKQASIQVWESSSPIGFSFDIILRAKNNTRTEIRDQHMKLLKLVAPSESHDGLMLRQPGPSALDAISKHFGQKSRNISLEIGTYLLLESVVVKSVSTDMSSMCDKDGIPIELTVNVAVESVFSCFTEQDITQMFVKK